MRPRPSASPAPWPVRPRPPPKSCPARPGASTPGRLGRPVGACGDRRDARDRRQEAGGPEQRLRWARNGAETRPPCGLAAVEARGRRGAGVGAPAGAGTGEDGVLG